MAEDIRLAKGEDVDVLKEENSKLKDENETLKQTIAAMKGTSNDWTRNVEHVLPRRSLKTQNIDFDNIAYHMNKQSIVSKSGTEDDNENAWIHGATSQPLPYRIVARDGFGTFEVSVPANIENFAIDGVTGIVTATTSSDLGKTRSLSNKSPNYLPNAKKNSGLGMKLANIALLLRHRHYATLDHPDGCVTLEKLSMDLQNRLSDLESRISALENG